MSAEDHIFHRAWAPTIMEFAALCLAVGQHPECIGSHHNYGTWSFYRKGADSHVILCSRTGRTYLTNVKYNDCRWATKDMVLAALGMPPAVP